MNPMIIAAGAAVAGLGYLGYKKFKTPGKDSYQSMSSIGPGGIPIMVATPVSNAVSVAQATATPQGPLTVGQYTPVPTTVPGQGVVYAPPGTVTIAAGGGIFQPAPILVTPAGSASIAVGSVKDVQHALNTLGYCKPPLIEDGKLGPLTINCIKAFQSKNRLTVDGNAGPATKAALSAALSNMAGGASVAGAMVQNSRPETGVVTAPTGVPINTTAALTMTVAAVQRALNILGASPKLIEDGKLGPKSVAAIKSFQTSHGLTPDGVAGPKTKSALYLASVQVKR
jgi:peptidoglycan hydrolase-like protein with peptidoglycan-binding domain